MTQVAEKPVRPVPPARSSKLVPGLAIGILALVVGGATATAGAGLLWGVIGAAGVIAAFRLTRHPLATPHAVILGAAVATSSVLTASLISELPERVNVTLCLAMAGAWGVTGLATAWVLRTRGRSTTTALNILLGWLGAGAIALPAATTFGVLTPVSDLAPGAEPTLGVGVFMVVGFIVGMVGLAPTLGATAELPLLGVVTIVVIITLFAAGEVGFSLGALIRDFRNVVNVPNFLPPDFGWAIGETGTWWWPASWEFGSVNRANPLLETFRISIIATVVGCGVALPVAFMASKITTPSNAVYLVDKGIMSLIRTIPDLFWALLFVAALSVGPLPGALALVFFSLGIMGKLFSETIDAVDPGPLEAARSTGSSHFPAVRAAVLPQVLPNYVAYALYIFEINIRASVVIGLAGAGGIGRVLEAQRSFFRFDRVLAIVILIFVLVFAIEQISVALRRRLV
ncbi:MAG: phosphonate ABC transporter, permease protein PhnE [Acidimicrobiia bacterium]